MHNNLRMIRRKHDLTQVELAKNVGTSRQTIINIEKKRSNPSLSLALKISEYLDVDVRDIFFNINVK